ncbi:conserved Plasmodium protein, unknown function [Plasmodium ovale]|uniref:Uncharacterized protein n=2 Tax=Plasmodium ovale TaxID=36330 RepID=A0A1A8VZE7_PLAOA|nr:hypothetical protein, conserved [Plasmodium ovale curtisi]SCP04934.1 conserved Plasmodium protein, unknown function [Plasmodium ovale]
MQNNEHNAQKGSKKGWVNELKGTYSNILNSGSRGMTYFSSSFLSDKNQGDDEKMCSANSSGRGSYPSDVYTDGNSIGGELNFQEKKKIIFEVYKKYYFIEMTEYHKSRENCTFNFLKFLDRLNEKMVETLKYGTYNISNLNKFFKEFLKNDAAYYRSISVGNTRMNNLTQSFLNLPVEEHSERRTSEGTTTVNASGNTDGLSLNSLHINNSRTNDFPNNTPYNSNTPSEGTNTHGSVLCERNECGEMKDKEGALFLKKCNAKNGFNKIDEIADNVINVDEDLCKLNHKIIDDWMQYGFMNYSKISNSMKITCDLIDSKICQKMLIILKESYTKEQENLIEGLKKKKNDFLKQIDLCKNYWKYFENSYSNSEKIRSDGIKDSKKIKCSWLCQRKYLKSVKILLKIQNEYLDIIYTSVKLFFQLIYWKKNTIRDILCSYILLYKSFLNLYIKNMNVLYDSILQDKNINISQFNNLNDITLINSEDNGIIKTISPFKFNPNCNSIPRLNNALNLINNSILFYNKNISVKSILCLFCSHIKGYLTSVGIFNKCVEGVIVITWDKFIHFFADAEDVSPQWSYYLDDVEFKIVKSKSDQRADANREPLKRETLEPAGTAEETAKETAKETAEETAKETAEETAKETAEETAKENAEETAKENAEGNAFIVRTHGMEGDPHAHKPENTNPELNTIKEESMNNCSTTLFNRKDNDDIEIQIKEKKKTLLLSSWCFTFKCTTYHLTNVCFELLNNHLCSPYFEDENSFTNFINIISCGQVKNDLLFTEEIANFYAKNFEHESEFTDKMGLVSNIGESEKGASTNVINVDNAIRGDSQGHAVGDVVRNADSRHDKDTDGMVSRDDTANDSGDSHEHDSPGRRNLFNNFHKKKNLLMKNMKRGRHKNAKGEGDKRVDGCTEGDKQVDGISEGDSMDSCVDSSRDGTVNNRRDSHVDSSEGERGGAKCSKKRGNGKKKGKHKNNLGKGKTSNK